MTAYVDARVERWSSSVVEDVSDDYAFIVETTHLPHGRVAGAVAEDEILECIEDIAVWSSPISSGTELPFFGDNVELDHVYEDSELFASILEFAEAEYVLVKLELSAWNLLQVDK